MNSSNWGSDAAEFNPCRFLASTDVRCLVDLNNTLTGNWIPILLVISSLCSKFTLFWCLLCLLDYVGCRTYFLRCKSGKGSRSISIVRVWYSCMCWTKASHPWDFIIVCCIDWTLRGLQIWSKPKVLPFDHFVKFLHWSLQLRPQLGSESNLKPKTNNCGLQLDSSLQIVFSKRGNWRSCFTHKLTWAYVVFCLVSFYIWL